MIALDLFAGTGWGVACKALGIEEHGVELMPAAVATREANGMRTAYRDAWEGLDHPELVPPHDLLIASPPCQTFSMAGAGAGRRALTEVLSLIEDGTWLDPDALRAFGAEHDDRTALVLTPLTYAMRYRPRAIVLEQVPPVLPVWLAIGRILGQNGYRWAAGVLHTEQYGVPQTRKRAILVARRWQAAALPTPTHSRYYPQTPDRLDPGVLPWVSMAQALGWGEEPELVGFPRADDGRPGGSVLLNGQAYRARDLRPSDQPARHVTGKARSWQRWTMSGAGRTAPITAQQRPRSVVEPAHTITGGGSAWWHQGKSAGRRVTVAEAAALQTYPEGFAWAGSNTSTFQQIGNAVPPLLALRVLEAVAPATLVRD